MVSLLLPAVAELVASLDCVVSPPPPLPTDVGAETFY